MRQKSSRSEAAFETVIEAHMLENGYVPIGRDGFDRERAIFPETVLAFTPRDPAEGVEQAGGLARSHDRRSGTW